MNKMTSVFHGGFMGGFGVSAVSPTCSTQTFIKNYNFLFNGWYAVPILYIYNEN